MQLFQSLLVLFVSCGAALAGDTHHLGLHPYEVGDVDMAPKVKRVAIIGAGAAGSSTSYFLSQYARSSNIKTNITLYEKNPYIGGRSTTVYAYDNEDTTINAPVELGASIFVKINHILYNATSDFNLTRISHGDGGEDDGGSDDDGDSEKPPVLGIFDGDIFVFTQEAGTSWWSSLIKLWWRYGLAPLKARNLMKEVTGRFQEMYKARYFPFASLTDTLYTLGLLEVTGVTGKQYLQDKGVGDLFAREIVQASTRVNYAQNLGLIHGVEAMVCLAAEGAMAVKGGNWRIFEEMLSRSAKVVKLSSEATSITRHKDGTFTIKAKDSADTNGIGPTSEDKFDTIILASPYQFSGLEINPAPQHIPDKIPYVNLHVTLFTSPHGLAPLAFKLKSTDRVPAVILTTLLEGEDPGTKPIGYAGKAGFFSISTLRTVKNPTTGKKEFLYKIFSPEEIDAKFLGKILGVETQGGDVAKGDVTWIYRKLWQSYPYEYPRVTFEELRLDENLWYTSGIESFISTMETSALMGRNVARLIVDEWLVKGKQTVFGGMREDAQIPLKAKL